MRTVAYIRVSSERQANEDRTSLADQRLAIDALAAKLGRVVGQVFEDGGKSGKTAEKRPAFMALVQFCRANPTKDGAILVLNHSRFGRFPDPDETGYWRTELRRVGWQVRYCENDDSGASITARHIMRAVGDAGASEYLATLTANIRRGVRGTAELGFWRTRPPFGYARQVVGTGEVLRDGQHKRPTERVKLLPDANAPIVRQVFERYATGGFSLNALGDWLATAAPGAREWRHAAQVRSMLGNRTYLGEIVTGDVVTPGAHEAIVSRALYAAAQARLDENRAHTRRVASDYPLSGLLDCAVCGHHFIGSGWKGGGRERHPYYMDAGPRHGLSCPGPVAHIEKHKVESRVVEIVGAQLADATMWDAIERHIRQALRDQRQTGGTTKAAITKRITTLTAERDRLVAAIGRNTVHESEAAPRLAAIRRDLDTLIAQRETFREPVADACDVERALAAARDFAATAAVSSGPALRGLLSHWIGHLSYDKRDRNLTVGINRMPIQTPIGAGVSGALSYELQVPVGGKPNRPSLRDLIVRRVSLGRSRVA